MDMHSAVLLLCVLAAVLLLLVLASRSSSAAWADAAHLLIECNEPFDVRHPTVASCVDALTQAGLHRGSGTPWPDQVRTLVGCAEAVREMMGATEGQPLIEVVQALRARLAQTQAGEAVHTRPDLPLLGSAGDEAEDTQENTFMGQLRPLPSEMLYGR